MAYIEELNGCCSALEIAGFDNFETKEGIVSEISDFLYGYLDETGKLTEHPTFFIATTKQSQKNAEKALRELKFTAKKFYGRHQPKTGKRNKYMTLWTKSSIPTGVLSELRKRFKEEGEYRRDIW